MSILQYSFLTYFVNCFSQPHPSNCGNISVGPVFKEAITLPTEVHPMEFKFCFLCENNRVWLLKVAGFTVATSIMRVYS